MRRVVSDAEISVGDTNSNIHREYWVRKSAVISMINWKHVLMSHVPQLVALGIVALFAQIVHQLVTSSEVIMDRMKEFQLNHETIFCMMMEVHELLGRIYENLLELPSSHVKLTALALFVGAWIMRRRGAVYLLSFATFKAPDSWKVTHDQQLEVMGRQNCFSQESLAFFRRILERSGTGQATAIPPSIKQCLRDDHTKSDWSLESTRKEAEVVIFTIVQHALEKAKVHPRDIDCLIINCSLFSPTPSLCAMVLSHFGMRSNVATYNLSGMGCSASLISIDLAQQLLLGNNNYKKALVVSTEILTPNYYFGNERAFLIQNALFRCGGAAIVLSSKWLDRRRAWYKLLHTVRVQGTGEAAYQCVYECEDKTGERGIRLSKDIVKVAGKCVEKNFTLLGPKVLPYSQQALVVLTVVGRWIQKKFFNSKEPIKVFVPDFKTGIDHFCIHAGGRAVIDGIEKNLRLEPYHTEASRMTLLNYGNTSSSSIWYELEYIQDIQKTNTLHKGDRILQLAFGSGFKCTSGVWVKL